MRDGAQNRGGMRDTRNIEAGIRDGKILAGSGCVHFNWWYAGFRKPILDPLYCTRALRLNVVRTKPKPKSF